MFLQAKSVAGAIYVVFAAVFFLLSIAYYKGKLK